MDIANLKQKEKVKYGCFKAIRTKATDYNSLTATAEFGEYNLLHDC